MGTVCEVAHLPCLGGLLAVHTRSSAGSITIHTVILQITVIQIVTFLENFTCLFVCLSA